MSRLRYRNLRQFKTCLEAANNFLLSEDTARTIFTHLAATIEQYWDAICEEAKLSKVDKKILGKAVSKPLLYGTLKIPCAPCQAI